MANMRSVPAKDVDQQVRSIRCMRLGRTFRSNVSATRWTTAQTDLEKT